MPIQLLSGAELPSTFYAFPHGVALRPEMPGVAGAGAHLLASDKSGEPVARASLWWNDTPHLDGAPTGYIGHYAVRPPADAHLDAHRAQEDAQTAAALLDAACSHLCTHGCAWAIGPLDGSTFRTYRFVTQRRVNGIDYPPFFLEPNQPDAWPQHFVDAGFTPLAHYHSALGALNEHDPYLATLQQRARKAGAHLRTVNLDQFEAELERIYAVVLAAFRRNFLYTPISAAEFMGQFKPIRGYIQPELAWIADKAGRAVGFLFALPDLAQAQRQEPIDTLIIKTVGVAPDAGVLGLGNLLTAQCQTAAYELGYRRVIHALMHDDNISGKISRRYAQTMRRYTLYAKRLG